MAVRLRLHKLPRESSARGWLFLRCGDQAVQVWAERAKNMLQHTGAAPLPLPSAFGPHLLHSARHGQPFARSHVSGADVRQVHEVHGLADHGAVDPSPPLLRLWFLHDAAAQLVPEVTHICGAFQLSS